MAATVTASIASLILTLDDPGRDDLSGVIVWGSTVNGFTPGVSNVLYKGNSLTIALSNLTPLTTYYLRYAYVSEIEPGNYEISAQLSGVPSKIDGSIIVDGSITAPQINATALRGKTVSGGVFVDGGSVVTADVAKPTDVTTTTTIYLEDTSDFPAAGAAFVVVRAGQIRSSASVVRYTGKTGTSLTGVSGIGVAILKGTVITPMPLPSFPLTSYAGGSTISLEGSPISLVGPTTTPDTAYDFMFRANGGSAIAISTVAVADEFTYAAGHYWMSSPGIYVSRLDGVTGLASFSAAAKSERIIIDDISIPKTVVATTGSKTSLTLTASTGYLNPNGGTVILASTTVSGLTVVDYSSYSGTTVTLSLATTITAATYYVIPLFSFNVYGAAQFPLFATSNTRYGLWTKSVIGPSRNITKNMLDSLELRPRSGNAIYIAPSQSTALDKDGAPVVIEAPDRYLHIDLKPIASTAIDATLMSTEAAFCLGAAYYASSGYSALVVYDSFSNSVLQYQPIGSTLRFSKYDAANLDAITFNDGTDSFSFDADGGSGNAKIIVGRIGIGISPEKLLHVYRNDSSTDAQIQIEQDGTGQATVGFLATGAFAWLIGIDAADNKFKIGAGGSSLSANTKFQIDVAGRVTHGGKYVPHIFAQSGTAVSVGAVTTEAVLATISFAGGEIGPNGYIQAILHFSCTNNANVKTGFVRLGGAAGTQYMATVLTSLAGCVRYVSIFNNNSQSAQKSPSPAGQGVGFGTFSSAGVTSTVNTAAAWDLVISAQKANTGDTLKLEGYQILVCYGA